MEKLHKHHIIPKHIGGTDDPSNLIELSISEHALEHKKLWEQYGRWQDYYAWKGLSGLLGKEQIHKEIMEKIRIEEMVEAISTKLVMQVAIQPGTALQATGIAGPGLPVQTAGTIIGVAKGKAVVCN